jgi:membrane-bound lytic murein transglycosylase B
LDFLDAQPEFSEPIWDYLDTLVINERIARGRDLMVKYATVFAAVE